MNTDNIMDKTKEALTLGWSEFTVGGVKMLIVKKDELDGMVKQAKKRG